MKTREHITMKLSHSRSLNVGFTNIIAPCRNSFSILLNVMIFVLPFYIVSRSTSVTKSTTPNPCCNCIELSTIEVNHNISVNNSWQTALPSHCSSSSTVKIMHIMEISFLHSVLFFFRQFLSCTLKHRLDIYISRFC